MSAQPWRADVRFSAVREGAGLYICLTADQPWEGRIIFDRPRHKLFMHLPLDYTRINQFPEWFVAEPDARYKVNLGEAKARDFTGAQLAEGVPVRIKVGELVWVEVSKQ